jgi:hypothetical protein
MLVNFGGGYIWQFHSHQRLSSLKVSLLDPPVTKVAGFFLGVNRSTLLVAHPSCLDQFNGIKVTAMARKPSNRNSHIGRLGELHAALRLTLAGWSVHNINDATANSANSDLLIYTEDGKSHYVSVKATNNLDEIRLTNRGDEGQSIFNTKSGGPVSDFVMFVAGADQIEPQVFMLPIKVAENMFAEMREHSYARKRERGSSIKFPYFMIWTRPPKKGKRKYQIDERLTAKLLKYEGVIEPK